MATIRPTDDFDAELRATQLREAMKGIGTDEDAVIAIVSRHTNAERQQISEEFKTKYGEDLQDRLKSELRGDLEQVTLALMTQPALYDAKELRRSMKGVGTDEATLIEIMCSRTNDEIDAIKQAYTEEFERDLEEDLASDSSGQFKRLLVSQCNGGRDEPCGVDEDQAMADAQIIVDICIATIFLHQIAEFSRDLEEDLKNDCSGQFKRLMVSQCNAGRDEGPGIDYGKARDDAQAIYDAGEGQWGTDEAEIQGVLCSRSYPQLKATFEAYAGIAGRDIEEAIESECSGSLQDGYLAIIKYAKSPSTFFAERLYKTMKGVGTDNDGLIRIVVSRSEIDLGYAKISFATKYEQTLAEFIDSDCGGDYKKMLLEIINAE